MTKPYVIYQNVRSIIDAPIILFCLWCGQVFFGLDLLIFKGIFYIFILLSLASWYVSANISKLYSDLRTNKFSEEIVYILFTVLLHAIFLTSLLFFFRNQIQLSNYFLLFYFSILFFFVVITKYILRKYLHSFIHKGKLQEKVLLVGSTPAAMNFYETIKSHMYYGYSCLGFLDNHQEKLNGCNYLGRVDDLPNVIQNYEIDEVIIALPNSAHEEIRYSVEVCGHYAKRVRIIPDFYFYASSNIQMDTIGLLPVINLRSLPQDRFYNKLIKRVFDIVFSISFFILMGWWLFPMVAILIKLTSSGPVYFLQERWGINNERIICYKFRTMKHGSPEVDDRGNFLQSVRNDSRVTQIGKYLRKYNIDEFPQFWNVLLGNMSIVGPRPHVTPLNLSSIKEIEHYLLRHLVKPGITGWAQVNGCRGETFTKHDMQARVNYDLYYIHRWTFRLDCWIILQTIVNIIKGDENAY
ncbi:MAG: undecaprenyl-phosphate glucose phosphotransferase [Oligoflexus sp.]|nr:undecaprenyl-phosphate glucose phosphotransferase [Pseudopedobacter sp.]